MTVQPLQLYGRRHGRPLRLQRTAALEGLLPRLRIELPPKGERIDPAALFPAPVTEVWLEIGFGGGEHLAAQAEAHPTVGIIGCEPFVNGVSSLCCHIARLGLTNVRLLPDDARPLLDALPDSSIGRCFLLFPDPWPKRRHWERRFIGPDNLTRLARVLRPGAELRLASDDRGLVTWMLDHVWHHPAFTWLARSAQDWRARPPDWPPTRYEQKALEAGRTPVFLRFCRRPD